MSLKRMLVFARPHYPRLVLGVLLALCGVASALVPPAVAKRIVDTVFTEEKLNPAYYEEGWHNLTVLILVMLAAVLGRSLSIFFRNILLESFGQKVVKDLKQTLYNHLQKLSFDFFHQNRTGELMARMTADIDAIRDLLAQGTIKLSFGIFYIVLTTAVLFRLNVTLALLAAIPVPLVGLTAYWGAKTIRPRFKRARRQYSSLNATVQENISGIRVVKTFNRQDFELEKFDRENEKLTACRNHSLAAWAVMMPILEFLSSISTVVLILFGGIMVIDGRITLGLWVQFSGYLWMLIMPMRMTGEIINAFSMASASADRVFAILETGSDIRNKKDPHTPEAVKGQVEFRNVSWVRNGQKILDDINIKAPAGSVVALMGPTGSGKSSLVNLISRFYDPTEGEILVDGVNVKDMDLTTLRSHVAMVMQEPFLFSETISNNISYGRVDASMKDIRRSARRSHAPRIHLGHDRQLRHGGGRKGYGPLGRPEAAGLHSPGSDKGSPRADTGRFHFRRGHGNGGTDPGIPEA